MSLARSPTSKAAAPALLRAPAPAASADRQIGLAEAAILKGVDAAMFVDDIKIWTEGRRFLLAEQGTVQPTSTEFELLRPNLGRIYRDKIGQLERFLTGLNRKGIPVAAVF